MLHQFFEIIQRCDGTEAMVLAAAALKQASKFDRGASRGAGREEFVVWFQEATRNFGSRAVAEDKPESQVAYYENEWMGMSAG